MKKNILFITPSLCQGGIEHSLITMLNLLDKSKYQITVFTYHEDITLLPLLPKEVEFINDKQTPHYFRKPKAMCLTILKILSSKLRMNSLNHCISEKLKAYIHKQKALHPAKDIFNGRHYDTIVSNAIGICTEMALYIKAKNRIVFYRASIDMHHDLLTMLLPKYDRIVAVSSGVKDMLAKNYPHVSDKIFVLENYVDSQLIIDKADEPLPVDISFDNSKLKLCTCGRFSEEKGFDMAVECANILKKQNIKFVWYFVGDGNEREKIDSLIEKYDLAENILITGYTDNPFPYIKACDIYVQPSYHESYGRTIKEAQILNKPIVSTDTVGGRTVLDNGKLGIITAIDANELANGILSMMPKHNDGFVYQEYTYEKNQAERELFINKLHSLLNG